MSNELQIIQNEIRQLQPNFDQALTTPHILFQKEFEFATQALAANEYLLNTACRNKDSLRSAIINVAALGISLNPAVKDAYLVPRGNKVCLDISYMGLLNIAIDTGAIAWGQAKLVFENDVFELVGIDKEPIHRCSPFSKDKGEIIGVYSVVKTAGGDYLTESMSVSEVNAIRDTSEAWKNPKTREYSPWFRYWGEMAKKTVIKRAYKLWPKTDKSNRLESAIHMLNTENGEGITDANHSSVDPTPIIEHVQSIGSLDALNAYWKSISGMFKAKTPERDEIVQACSDRKKILLNSEDVQAAEVVND